MQQPFHCINFIRVFLYCSIANSTYTNDLDTFTNKYHIDNGKDIWIKQYYVMCKICTDVP